MAFTVTPTSGDGPYVLAANITDSDLIDNVNYQATIRHTSLVGSCPPPYTGNVLSAVNTARIVAGESVELTATNVPAGSCRTFSIEITRVSDSLVIDSSFTAVDNL